MNKKRIGKLLFLIVFLITLVIGFSYAFSNWNYIGSTFNKLTSSDLEISLLESETNVISLNNAFPMTDEEGLDTDSFDFAVTSKTVKEEGIRYTISIEKLEADTGYTFLNDSDVKIYLEDYEGNVLLEPTLISNLDNYKLYTGSHVHDSTNNELQDKYKLKVWIDQSKENDAKSWDLDTKIQYKFKLNINNEETNNTFTVNAVAEGGTITGSNSKKVVSGGEVRFDTSPTETYSETSVSCTNSQNGTIKNGKLVVTNVTSNTTCTITYTPSKTVLYTDGTLIINEKASDRASNITTHGAVRNEYQALSNQNAYIFNSTSSQPWYSNRESITRVEIGQKIQPTNTQYWFSQLTKMSYGDFTNLDTSNVTNMISMFDGTGTNSSVTSFEIIGLNNWNTLKVTDMRGMFHQIGLYATTWSIGDLSNWDTSKVTTMSQMFTSAGGNATTWSIGDLSNWDTSKVTDMSYMFQGAGYSATMFELDLSNWYTSNVTNMSYMFYDAGESATTWSIGDLSSWDTSKVTTMHAMFFSAGYHATNFNISYIENWDTSKVTSMYYMFASAGRSATTWSIGDLSNWDTSQVTTMSSMFSSAGRSATTFDIGNLSSWDTSKVTDMSEMFVSAGRSATTWSIGDLSNWDTSKVTDMSNMFNSAGYNATTWRIGDLSRWNTSNVTRMGQMFRESGNNATAWNNIGTLDVYATDIYQMFYNSSKATATLNIYSNPSSDNSGYKLSFYSAATADDALIVVNGSCNTTNIDNIIATKSSSSHVIKGIQFGCGADTEYPVVLDAQGGTIPSSAGWTLLNDGGVAPKNYVENTALGMLPIPTYRNYEFLGWYTKQEGGTKVTSSTNVTKSMNLYAHYNIPSWNVSVSVNNGTVSGDTYKIVKDYNNATFNVSTTLEGTYVSSVTCTNGQYGAVNNGIATIYNVTNNTACTIEYSDAGSTVLYTDGTLVINEKASDREANITTHGAVTNEYAAMSNSNAYVFSNSILQPWYSQRASVTRVEMGQKIQPTDTKRWFYNLTKMSYGDFTNLDTSQSTSMDQMFYQTGYNSSVTSFELIGLDSWNTSNVTTMFSIFCQAGRYATTWSIGDLSNWDTSKVTNAEQMFTEAGYNATTFNIGSLFSWNTSKITITKNMFTEAGYNATIWNIGDISTWNTSKVANMDYMFYRAGYNAGTFDIGNLSNWDTSKVTSMSSMFNDAGRNATTWTIGDLSNWDTSKVTSMSSMFSNAGYSATTWTIGDLSNWDTSKVTTMNEMFSSTGENVTTFELDLSNWNVSSVTNMYGMFSGAGSNATTWSIGDLSNWDTSKVTTMAGMFSNAGQRSATFSLNLSEWNVSKVTTMQSMFYRAGEYSTTWIIGNLTSWDTSRVNDMSQMFYYAGREASSFNSIGTLNIYASNTMRMFGFSYYIKATLNLYNSPTSYTEMFSSSTFKSGALITLNYNCTTAGVVDSLIATKISSDSNVVKGTNLDGTCPDRTISVTVNNGTINTSSTTVPNLGSATFDLTPTSGYSHPSVSCTNGQNGSMSGNTLTVSNVVSDTTCTVTYYDAIDVNLTENDATYPWVETSGVWKSGNYNVNSSTSTITSESFTLTNGGAVSFDWAVSSESANYDYLYYTIYKDGVAVSGTGTSTKIGGNNTVVDEANLSYTTVSKELDAGTYTIAFSYRKDGSVDKGLDRGYVKNIFVLK